MAGLLGINDLQDHEPPKIGSLTLREPRITPPRALDQICSADPRDRVAHAYGKAFRDIARNLLGQIDNAPDVVARPATEGEVVDVLDWCADAGVAAIPFGGGSSVVGGIEARVGDDYAGAVSIDLTGIDRVLEVDAISLAARIQAGGLGPVIEEQLRPHGLTMRHYPQSFEFSSLGGWLATRAGGHFATVYTHIDDLTESIRAVTPVGISESRRLPGSGAGPSPDRMLLGSEGTLGIITEAWMRLQRRPRWRGTASVRFADFETGVRATRAISQSGLFPSNCRLLDETADKSSRQGAAGTWRSSFVRAPYTRDALIRMGLVVDTFETAVTWDRFDDLHRQVMTEARRVIDEVCGTGIVTCRFTHVYPDGPAPYFSVIAPGRWGDQAAQWDEVKAAVSEVVAGAGGTITHHHATGRDHRPWYDRQRPDVFAAAFRAAKAALDPSGVLNPGVLLDP